MAPPQYWIAWIPYCGECGYKEWRKVTSSSHFQVTISFDYYFSEPIIQAHPQSAGYALISSIASEYSFESISGQASASANDMHLRIGFVGEFSSGKSTLLNAMLGDELLPSRATPTTANVVRVEAVANLPAVERIITDDNGQIRALSEAEFATLVQGTEPCALTLRVPAGGNMLPGLHLIDTPGINSPDAAHLDLAIAQLTLLDGIVVCLNPEVGTVPASVLSFLARPEIMAIESRLLFVVTSADQKEPQRLQLIADAMAARIASTLHSRQPPSIVKADSLGALEGRSEGIAGFLAAFHSTFIHRAKHLRAERYAKHLNAMAKSTRSALQAFLDALSLDDGQLRAKLSKCESRLAELEGIKRMEETRLADWCSCLEEMLRDASAQFAPVFAIASATELELAHAQLDSVLKSTAALHIEGYAPGTGVQLQELPPASCASLIGTLKAHAKYVSSGVSLATAAAAAALGAGSLAAVGSAALTSGSIGKVVATEMLRSILLGSGQKANEASPLAIAGDAIRVQWNRSEVQSQLSRIAVQLANAYRVDMQRHLQETCFRQLGQDLASEHEGMQAARLARSEMIDQTISRKQRALGQLSELDDFIATGRGWA